MSIMSIKGIGVDMEEVGRFRKLPYKSNQSFYKKIFTSLEIRYCVSKTDPAQHFAVRFAAKEAIAKALGQSIYNAKDFEVVNNKKGQPNIRIRNQESGIKILISLSHAKNYAVAVVFVYSW